MSSKKTYFIDVENVGSKPIAQFLSQDKSSDVVVVTGPMSNVKASGAVLEELSKGKNSRVDVIHTDISRDQIADKLLLVKVGEYRGRYPNRQLVIVSKDKGFKEVADIMNTHWGSNLKMISSLPVSGKMIRPQKKTQPQKKVQPQKKTQPQKKAQPQKKTQPQKKAKVSQKSTNAEWEKYWETISNRTKRNRPKTNAALLSSISNIGKTGIKTNPDAVIKGLISNQKMSVKNGNITWLDNN